MTAATTTRGATPRPLDEGRHLLLTAAEGLARRGLLDPPNEVPDTYRFVRASLREIGREVPGLDGEYYLDDELLRVHLALGGLSICMALYDTGSSVGSSAAEASSYVRKAGRRHLFVALVADHMPSNDATGAYHLVGQQ